MIAAPLPSHLSSTSSWQQAAIPHPTTPIAPAAPPSTANEWRGMVRSVAAIGAWLAASTARRRPGMPASSGRTGRQVVSLDFVLLAGDKAKAAGGEELKTVHFIRHSEALVNAAGRKFDKDDPRKKAVRLDPEYFDSALSEKGLAQALQLGAGELEGCQEPPEPEIVAASPLTRAMQTATAIFGCDKAGGPQLFALEALREFCSKDFQPCDSRKHPKEHSEAFSHVDFGGVPWSEDTLLGPGKVETPESADARIRELFGWIRERKEKSITCVAHFQILSRIFAEHLEPAGWDNSKYGGFDNLEVRSVPIAFK